MKISVEKFKANLKILNWQNLEMTLKPVAIFGRFKVASPKVITFEPRVQLHVPKEGTFPIPRIYIDVTRSTNTDLDVLQEKKIDEHWNVDSSKHLSDSWQKVFRNCQKRTKKTEKTCGTSNALQAGQTAS